MTIEWKRQGQKEQKDRPDREKTKIKVDQQRIKAKGAEDIVVVCGGVIPQRDYQFLYDCGVRAIFGPGTNILDAASEILKLIPGKNR